ncbi:hypothetical protein [Thermococcus sp.]|nr:hypothetical protein [Thermococcus sp.]
MRFNFNVRKADKKLPARVAIAMMDRYNMMSNVFKYDFIKRAEP